jgi:hypothetical protein
MSNEQVMNAFPTNGASPGGEDIMIPDYTPAVVTVRHAPPGSYPAVVSGFCKALSKSSDAPMLVFDFRVDVGGGKTLERSIYCTMPVPMTANALGKIKRTCLALEVPPNVPIKAALVVGRKCTVHLVDGKEYKGKVGSDVDGIDLPGQATGATATADAPVPAFPVGGDDIAF